jgi:hypothetical protein
MYRMNRPKTRPKLGALSLYYYKKRRTVTEELDIYA